MPFSFLYNMVKFDDLIAYGKKIQKFQFPRVPKDVCICLCNMKFKADQIWSNKKRLHVRNHAKINNLTSIHFNY